MSGRRVRGEGSSDLAGRHTSTRPPATHRQESSMMNASPHFVPRLLTGPEGRSERREQRAKQQERQKRGDEGGVDGLHNSPSLRPSEFETSPITDIDTLLT